jgi:hypothetical protein
MVTWQTFVPNQSKKEDDPNGPPEVSIQNGNHSPLVTDLVPKANFAPKNQRPLISAQNCGRHSTCN